MIGKEVEVTCDCPETSSLWSCFAIQAMICWDCPHFHSDVHPHTVLQEWKRSNTSESQDGWVGRGLCRSSGPIHC